MLRRTCPVCRKVWGLSKRCFHGKIDTYHGKVKSMADAYFSSRGVRQSRAQLPLFDRPEPKLKLFDQPLEPILKRITRNGYFSNGGVAALQALLAVHSSPAVVNAAAFNADRVNAGKNTYTYDAHTYHTKVPPQGILELLKHYLPEGGLILDPFAGSGMTGVAAQVHGSDCILNELSPAASFIAHSFTNVIEPTLFAQGVQTILNELQEVREALYTTHCRECGKSTEILYTVWSYQVLCYHCNHEFLLWDHCRRYGKTVREHQILSEFSCPNCQQLLKKSKLQRTSVQPVLLGYKCCGSRQQEVTHPLTQADFEMATSTQASLYLARDFYPQIPLPDGVNLRQPAKHGLDEVAKLYTVRNLAALSQIWRTIHRVESTSLASQLAFVFTSLYQRVTRLSEFRFWGGSGNTARFNVPFIFNETNVFLTFARKAHTIQDHLETTASHYHGRCLTVQHSATQLNYLPDESIDLIFTDPPFGANINYSDMNFLWESWLGTFTDTTKEVIINRIQSKGISEYQQLMTDCLRECYRVLRKGHPLLLIFMNSSQEVWKALKNSVLNAGFEIQQISTFDKQQGTFKQFVSDNTAGYDLVLHCLKPKTQNISPLQVASNSSVEQVLAFLNTKPVEQYTHTYAHVDRSADTDFRQLYSQWTAQTMLESNSFIDFTQFREIAENWFTRVMNRESMLMHRPQTRQAFTPQEQERAHHLLATRVATMMNRKFEEGDWAHVYCTAKQIPLAGWSNLNIDIMYQGLGVEHKMLSRPSDIHLKDLRGTRLMHPSATRAIRIPQEGDPNQVMADVLAQYANLIEQRRAKVAANYPGHEPDMRTGWLLWQTGLQEFLYFEEEMLPPNPDDYFAEWRESSGGSRKKSKNLWVYEKDTGQKRYSITTAAGAKIQPYFDVPPPNDPHVYYFRVQGESLEDGLIRVWITPSTQLELKRLVGNLQVETISTAILEAAEEPPETHKSPDLSNDLAVPITLTKEAYDLLTMSFPGVSDEHRIQQFIRQLSA